VLEDHERQERANDACERRPWRLIRAGHDDPDEHDPGCDQIGFGGQSGESAHQAENEREDHRDGDDEPRFPGDLPDAEHR
jgi:hypothetical protein